MNSPSSYFLLRKNNSLQTIDNLISPYVFASKDKEEALLIKQQLELLYLRGTHIHFHFDHIVEACDQDIIDFDRFLVANYDFSFLTAGFDHRQKDVKGHILYSQKFPAHLTDDDLMAIQKRLDKYHFDLIEQGPNNKAIILLNPWSIDNPLRDGEIVKLQEIFDSKEEAQRFIDGVIEAQFDVDGTYLTVGDVTEAELTNRTNEVLNSQCDIRYKSKAEGEGMKFVSPNKLSDIVNGMEILLDLYESIGKKPYEILELS